MRDLALKITSLSGSLWRVGVEIQIEAYELRTETAVTD